MARRARRFKIAPPLGIPLGYGVFYSQGYGGSSRLSDIGPALLKVLAFLRRSSLKHDGPVIGYGLTYGKHIGE